MSLKSEQTPAWTVVGLCLICGIVGGLGGAATAVRKMQAEAVEHGAASYDPQTGEWKWNEQTTVIIDPIPLKEANEL